MSRVGKKPITLPKGVEVAVNGRSLSVKGPKGNLTMQLPASINAAVAQNQGVSELTFTTSAANPRQEKKLSPLWGTMRALSRNMMVGVTEGYSIVLNLVGVGYRAQSAGSKLNMSLGYSHPIELDVPQGITVAVKDQTEITISGTDKQSVGEFAALVRGKRPPEPFKGKGVKYANEHIAMKEGKKK